MGIPEEVSKANIAAFKAKPVSQDANLERAITRAEADPHAVASSYYGYYRTIRDLFNLAPADITTITAVNKQLQSFRGADTFLTYMAPYQDQLLSALRQIGNLDLENNRQGLDQLAAMMNNAREIRQTNPLWTPKDGDPKSDRVIWGFVRGAVSPETDIHFTLCHGVERMLTRTFRDSPIAEFTDHKDWLLNALNDVIALRGLQGKGYGNQVLDLWSAPRPNGLGWISPRRLDAFKAELGIK
jgi:hypothetical protein